MSKFIKLHNQDNIISSYINLDNVVEFDVINDTVTMTNGTVYTITSQQQVEKVKEYIQNNMLW